MQAIVPMLIGMKSAGIAVFGLFMVSVITIKAFMASKMALMVSVGMALKKLYESYGNGAGLQNHPYLYSQYPIDFPNPTSHAYSVNGVSPQFASPELYSPTALGSHSQQHELIQQSDATAQQSQQAPTQLLVNATRAAERWDGKSKLFKIFEPVVDTIRSFVDPIANVFYDAMPTFRGLSSDVSTAKSVETDAEEKKKPREILIPQPRNIAQRKMSYRKSPRHRPKKIPETSNVLWNLARYFRFLFGLPETPLSAPSMNMPMYALPQMQDMQAMQDMQNMQSMQSQMFSPQMGMPTAQ